MSLFSPPPESFLQLCKKNRSLLAAESTPQTLKDKINKSFAESIKQMGKGEGPEGEIGAYGRVFNKFSAEDLTNATNIKALSTQLATILKSPLVGPEGAKEFNTDNKKKLAQLMKNILDLAAKELLDGHGNLKPQIVDVLGWKKIS